MGVARRRWRSGVARRKARVADSGGRDRGSRRGAGNRRGRGRDLGVGEAKAEAEGLVDSGGRGTRGLGRWTSEAQAWRGAAPAGSGRER